ncbi:hypothetical protein ACS0TY_017964 [Phlomoides rotata]
MVRSGRLVRGGRRAAHARELGGFVLRSRAGDATALGAWVEARRSRDGGATALVLDLGSTTTGSTMEVEVDRKWSGFIVQPMRSTAVEGLHITKNTCIQLLAFTSLFIALLLLITKGSYKNLSLFSLPAWASSSSSFSGVHRPPPPPPVNPDRALYPTFTSPKMQKAVENLKKELNEKSMLRRGTEKEKRVGKIEASLVRARALIKEAIIKSRDSPPLIEDSDYVPQGEIYRNPYVFQRSYMLMEKMFKIYVYAEGDPPMFHNGPSKDIYSTEGIFLGFLESNTHLRTYDPDEAHLYFLPFSVVMILENLFDPVERDKGVLERVVTDYIRIVSTKYPYWNTTLGADHFMLSCHDWGPFSTKTVPNLFHNSMRVLCNANTSEGFNPKKDVSLPEINIKTGETEGLLGGTPPLQRPFLAFFAGGLHGQIRSLLLGHWKDRDPDVRVYDELPRNVSYETMLRSSKFCLCPSGYEVASPRVVEAIYAECVPVLMSDGYVPPLSDVLNWKEFSIVIEVENIVNVKKVLMEVSEEKYLRMHGRLRQVQRHFIMNEPPKRFDLFHMTVHSIWLRRLNIRIRKL